ncbi:Uma2 family endonuclease [Streptomyces sp. NPDC048200]|uniref:Uma2 family endonuclease n=1 Tax=Streptomyces sp. NPDC048200 TaxID=3365512 RepID=UPI003713F925
MSVVTDHTGPWTLADVLALPEDCTTRYELLGESLVTSPAPGVRHQRASFRLHVTLDAAARAASAPVEVLEAIDAGATAEDTVSVNADVVQLVVEIVSPGNRMMDRKVKPLLYAEAAIPHFWHLEFEPAPRLILSELQGGRYVTLNALVGATTRIDAPFPVDIDPVSLVRQ